ncbi:uncharacterized protein MEPE_01474 [Melanopsichium pennsylvanicum]|uniref:Uncharacterized protein n=2 Tax=Melanopsichium pennsylvanicum TaxID=63383 RepID=A0AAJ5C3Q2_9BASI|nr:putative protein [Melanopsichium pennsylvanicum 4]SNX82768.1 uncharacterized protein MEPE_01474 [Melanopsichium pennsylvanicum]
MPTATKRREASVRNFKRRPSATARSESGYSRRSSVGSFKTANGASSDYAPGGISASEQYENEDEADPEYGHDATMIRSTSKRSLASDEDGETETVSRQDGSPNGFVAAEGEHDDQASSNASEESLAIFHAKPSSDTSTVHKSPPTSQDDAASHDATVRDQRSPLQNYNSKFKPARHELLIPDTALASKGRADRKGVRASHASHLTLPYQPSEAGDYLESSRRLSKMTMSSYDPRSRAPSRAASFMDDILDMEMRDARHRSVSERGGTRSSRLLAPASVRDFGGSVSDSYQPQRGTGSRYASSYIEPSSLRSPSKQDTRRLHAAGIHHRDSDRLSINSRGTARKPASVTSKTLDADTQVFPGTRIRKYIEPQLNEAMRRVMKQFSGHSMQDHRCNGYPIAVFVGATAIDTGSIIQPHVSGSISLYFGPGHPKNMASLLPEEDRTPSHIPNPKAPTPASLSRRAELRSAITALHTIYELYRGRACAHVCIDSAYVAKAWGTWIPTWELKGWPGEDDEQEGDRERWEEEYYERRRTQRRAYDRHGTRYMHLPDRRDRDRSRDGYASDGGRYRSRDSRAQPRSRYNDRDDWLSSDPYADRSRRRGDRGPPPQSPRRRGNRRDYDYSSEEDDYNSRRGGRRRYDDEYGSPYSPDRAPPRRRPMRRAPGRRLVDEDLLRELADIRYEFARVERDRQGSAHLYLIDRSNNPADRMARAVAKSEGSLLHLADEFDTQSEIGLHVDEAPLSDDDNPLGEEDDDWLETRSRFSTRSKSTKGGARVSSRNSRRENIISNATGRLRTSASLPSGHLRGGPRRQLDTFAEEDEDDLAEDAKSVRSVRSQRSERSRKSTRAERERDDYLARQDKFGAAEAAAIRRSTQRSASRASHLSPPAPRSEAGGARRSLDSRRNLFSPEPASKRGSMDSRRRMSNVRSQTDIRSQNGRSGTAKSALASAAVINGEDLEEEESFRPRSSLQMHQGSPGGSRHPRTRMMSAENDYPEMEDLVPPVRMWDNGSVYSRNSIDSRRGPASPRKGFFGGTSERQPPQSPSGSERKGFGLFSNRSTPSLHRAPAPEDPDYEWSKSSRKSTSKGRSARQQREWHSTTPKDYNNGAERSQWEPEEGAKKSGFLSRMFGRKK